MSQTLHLKSSYRIEKEKNKRRRTGMINYDIYKRKNKKKERRVTSHYACC